MNGVSHTLAARSGERQDTALARTDAAADAAERAVRKAWQQLLVLLGRKPPLQPWAVQHALRPILHALFADVGQVLHGRLTDLARWGHDSAAATLRQTLPVRYLLTAAARPGRRPLREGTGDPGLLQFGLGPGGLRVRDPLAPFRGGADVSGRLPNGGAVAFARHEAAPAGEVAVWVDPRRLDADWQRDEGYYLPPQGEGRSPSEIAGRRAGFRRFLKTGEPVQAPRMTLDADGTVSVEDGRHRFAVLRDLDLDRVPVMVPAEQADAFAARYGQAGAPEAPLLPPTEEGQREYLSDFLLPPLSLEDTVAILRRPILGRTWQQDWTAATKLADPNLVMSTVAGGLAAGQTPREIARTLQPVLQGVQSSARRIARTYGMEVAHHAQMQAHQQLGDLVIGYQVHALHDQHTRPWHAKRDGTIYYLHPKNDQKGPYQMPHPPLEADDPRERPSKAPHTAWNCRCHLTPVLRPI